MREERFNDGHLARTVINQALPRADVVKVVIVQIDNPLQQLGAQRYALLKHIEKRGWNCHVVGYCKLAQVFFEDADSSGQIIRRGDIDRIVGHDIGAVAGLGARGRFRRAGDDVQPTRGRLG